MSIICQKDLMPWGGGYVNAREEGCQRGFTEFQRIGKIHQIEEGWEMEGIEDVECLSRSN